MTHRLRSYCSWRKAATLSASADRSLSQYHRHTSARCTSRYSARAEDTVPSCGHSKAQGRQLAGRRRTAKPTTRASGPPVHRRSSPTWSPCPGRQARGGQWTLPHAGGETTAPPCSRPHPATPGEAVCRALYPAPRPSPAPGSRRHHALGHVRAARAHRRGRALGPWRQAWGQAPAASWRRRGPCPRPALPVRTCPSRVGR